VKYPTISMLAPVMLALAMSRAAVLQAQSPAFGSADETAARLAARSRERAREWDQATPVIHCAPAPLTERPGASAEAARPRLVPLEQAFLDAAIVRREVPARSQTVVNRP
jgi:hypothetical protein